ncbi:hypothetical protein P280DRAFT_471490, partial [Massarina eburnea CBS 473.64]
MRSLPIIKPIEVRVSRPADPSLPSFVTLPNETRNAIYSLLFEFSTPVRVLFACRTDWSGYKWPAIEEMGDKETKRNIHSAMPLLLTCTSIYNEAATTLYTNNAFTITGPPRYSIEVEQAANSGRWMRGIGSQVGMLRKVYIDLSVIYPAQRFSHYTCEDNQAWEASVAMLPLLHILWANPELKADIIFVQSHSERMEPPFYIEEDSEHDAEIDCEALTKTLKLLQQDVLRLRRYWRFIRAINVSRDGSRGLIEYGRRRNGFSLSNNGGSLIFEDSTPHNLLNLTGGILDVITKMITVAPKGVKITQLDLDKKTCTGGSPVFASVCKKLRKSQLADFWCENKVRVKLTSQDTRTTFSNFKALQVWWCVNKTEEFPYEGRFRLGPRYPGGRELPPVQMRELPPVQIHLQFEAPKLIYLHELCIGVLDLVRIFTHAPRTKFEIYFSIANPNRKNRTSHKVVSEDLQKEVLTTLLEYQKVVPDQDAEPCPQVWVTGRGHVMAIGNLAHDGADLRPLSELGTLKEVLDIIQGGQSDFDPLRYRGSDRPGFIPPVVEPRKAGRYRAYIRSDDGWST